MTPGVSSGGLTVIDKGLEPGERVVVDGLDRLRDGTAVRVAATVETPRAESVDGTAAADSGAAPNAPQGQASMPPAKAF